MSALVLDAGALIAVDRNDRRVVAMLEVAQREGRDLRTNANVVAQVWRDPKGRQVRLARLLSGVDVRSITEEMGRAAGVLLGAEGGDVVDASVVLIANSGDYIVTSDPIDIKQLIAASGSAAFVIAL